MPASEVRNTFITHGDCYRNLVADILLQAMGDVLPPAKVQELADADLTVIKRHHDSPAAVLLRRHKSAVHYFRSGGHIGLCEHFRII